MGHLRVLVVDDDKDFAESLALVIEGRGHEVTVAFSGTEAIENFRSRSFDIAFMDVRLPGKNGVESFLEIRRLKPDARVVMMTGYSLEQLLDQAVRNGAWGVLRKPFDMEQMLTMIERIKPEGVLIADDDPDFVAIMSDLLTADGWSVHTAKNGREAVERVKSDGVDILVLDLRMPLLNGLDTYVELRQSGHAVPTIIVTAFADEEADSIEKLLSMSVNGILRKPFDPQELLRMIAAVRQTCER